MQVHIECEEAIGASGFSRGPTAPVALLPFLALLSQKNHSPVRGPKDAQMCGWMVVAVAIAAKFMGTETAILYSYDAATPSSVIPAFAKKEDLVRCLVY